MVKKWLPVGLLVMLSGISSADTRPLPDLFKPYSPVIADNRFIIFEGSDFSYRIYSLPDLKPLGRFGRRGEGPGEFTGMPQLTALQDGYFICGPRNAFWFSPDGELIRQQKIPPFVYLTPLGDKFIGEATSYDQDGGYSYHEIFLYSGSLEKIRRIYRQKKRKILNENPNIKQNMMMIDPHFSVQVSGNRLYIADTRKGFYIAVFDDQGILCHEIRREMAGVPVNREYKDQVMERYKTSKLWLENKRNFNYIFPEFFPPIKDFTADDDRLYVWTHTRNNEGHRLLILDRRGETKQALYLPYRSSHQTFADDRFYYLQDTGEKWELVTVPLIEKSELKTGK